MQKTSPHLGWTQVSIPELGPLSPRVALLKSQAPSRYSPALFAQRAEVYRRVRAETRGEPQLLRAAKCLAAFLREKEIILTRDDLLAGHVQPFDYDNLAVLGGWAPFLREKDYTSKATTSANRNATYPPVGRETVPCIYELPDGSPRDDEEIAILEQFCRGIRMGLFFSWPGGHVIANYAALLREGLGSRILAAQTRLETAEGPARDFAEASLIVCRAASDYARRYAERAAILAQDAGSDDARIRMERIAAACRHVSSEPPRTFFEAVQLLWLAHEIAICEQESGSMSLGRLDQYLFPFFAADLASGLLTSEEAAELIEAFWLKCAGLRRSFQNVTLAGPANELTYLCMRATRKLRMDQPLLSVRWRPDLPPEFWAEIQALIETGTGFPALFNDTVSIAAKRRVGLAAEDAENYGIVGCVELSAPGKEYSHTEALRINWAKVLELMLHGGNCPVTDERLPLSRPHRLETISSFAEFYAWYRAELAHFTDLAVRGLNLVDRFWPELMPYPYLSSLMEGCLESGRDVTAGGAVYNLSSVNGMGMADVADSLVAVQRLVFDERRITLPALAESLRSDDEALRPAMLHCPKYGNDEDGPDALLAELAHDFCRQIERYRNPRGGRFQVGLYTVDNHVRRGKRTGALPSGRARGVALANALSPCQGADTAGPTAVVRSITRLDHADFGNGMVLDLKFHPAFFQDAGRQKAFRALVETYFRLGGMEIQFNVVSRDTLLAAQRSPQEYRDLLVRVSGFSAYFIDLDRVCQDEIIARTELKAI